ncbi:MAG: cytochrome P450 [Pirellulales bacterium]
MAEIPRDHLFDSSLAIVADPYGFIGKRCDRVGADLFRTRLLLKDNICMRGRDAAEIFYDQDRFYRKGAVVPRAEIVLAGRGGVQGLDHVPHHHRKAMFTSVVGPHTANDVADRCLAEWRKRAKQWAGHDSVLFYNQTREVICRAVSDWAGVPISEAELPRITWILSLLYEFPVAIGWRHWRARWYRKVADRWAAQIIEDTRAGKIKPPAGTALDVVAKHRELEGNLLPAKTAGVELQNILRPTVAVSVFVVYAAKMLHEHPECREPLAAGGNEYLEMFVQEVRRHCPFFPAVAARVRQDFEWRGYKFPKDMRVLFGLHATNHDPKIWNAPHEFWPERFRNWQYDPFTFVPQGGGDREQGHRCPGDRFSVEITKAAVRFLTEDIAFDVPPQDLSLEMTHMPALPRSRFLMRNVRARSGVKAPAMRGQVATQSV